MADETWMDTMFAAILQLGSLSVERIAAGGRPPRQRTGPCPLAAYPVLRASLVDAERSGRLAAEKIRLMGNRLAR